jgi:dephospho-CoA kinase
VASARKIPVIGLVGGIGSGKSSVAGFLKEAGCLVADSDALVRAELERPDIRGQLQSWWGPGILDGRGAIDRKAVSAIVFRDSAERARLEALLHPRVEAARNAMFDAAPSGTRALVIDAPLLLEAGLAGECTRIWFIEASETARRGRVLSERGWTADELDRRESVQWSLDRKRAAAHHVLRNDGDPASLREQVLQALGQVPAVG